MEYAPKILAHGKYVIKGLMHMLLHTAEKEAIVMEHLGPTLARQLCRHQEERKTRKGFSIEAATAAAYFMVK